jgi:hypothetical protein
MAYLKEEYICIRFCCKLGGKECYINFQNIECGFWRAENEKNTSFFKWFSKLKTGVTTVEDAQDVKCISHSKIDEIVDPLKELPFEVIKISNLDVVNGLGISFGSVQSILKYILPMYCLAFTFVPCLLS